MRFIELERLPQLEDRAKALARRRETKDKASSLLADLAKERERLDRLFPSRTWHGVNNPLRFYAAEWGKQQHRRMAASHSCDVSDQPFGSAGRPDCIKADGCVIFEFKSKNDRAVNAGKNKLPDCVAAVTAYYEEHAAKGTDPDSDRGGKAIMRAFGERGCLKDKRLRLDRDVKTYDMCDRVYKCVEN